MKMLFLIAVVACAQDQTGGVSGIVRDAVSHQPVKKAMITINPTQFTGVPPNPQSASTDVAGTFSIDNLPAGRYQLTVQHQNYPQPRNGAVHKSVTINGGEKAGPIEVDLIPPGTVSGRVFDEDGDPLNGCIVQAHPAAHPEQGAQGGPGTQGPAADGEYRLYGLPPGKYILSAQCNQPVFQPRPFSAGPDPPPTLAYQMQYYPIAADAKSAQVIELTPASERSGVDFRMRPAAVTSVRATFSPPGPAAPNLRTQLLPADWKPGSLVFFPRQLPDTSGGSVRFQQVFPGSYTLIAFQPGQEGGVGAMQRIEVKDQPIETVIELKSAINVSGTVEIVGTGSTKVSPNQVHLYLRPEYPFGMQQGDAEVGDDGTFSFKSVLPVSWRLQAAVVGAFLKSAMLGSTDVTEGLIDLSSGTAEPLKLVLSTNMSTIRGTAPPGSTVWALNSDPSPFVGRTAVQADPSGQFNFPVVAPGKYRVALGEPGEMPDDSGEEVTVHEGETVTVDLKPPAQ